MHYELNAFAQPIVDLGHAFDSIMMLRFYTCVIQVQNQHY